MKSSRRFGIAASWFSVLLFLLAFSIAAIGLSAEEIPFGKGNFVHEVNGSEVPVWTYRPAGLEAGAPIAVVCHGTRRNGETYRDQWIDLAREHRFLLVVPELTREAFPGARSYNQGNLFARSGEPNPAERWSFGVVEAVFDEVRARAGSEAESYFLYGHSAGAQFVQRMLFFAPALRVERAVMANAGWYTMPDPEVPYPFGLKESPIDSEVLKARFAEPHLVLLGTEDNDPEARYLNRSPEADEQGLHRFERGNNFFNTARDFAESLDAPFNWSVQHVPGVAHSNSGMAPFAVEFWLGYLTD